MPTEKPKISAYVPPVVYQSFKEYEKQHGGSMSQAVTQLIADYFDIDLTTQTIQSNGGLQNKITCLHDEIKSLDDGINELKATTALLSQKVDDLEVTASSNNQNYNQLLLPLRSNTNDELPQDIRCCPINTDIDPLTLRAYAERIGRSITTMKRIIVRPIEVQIEYTQKLDPEHKAWVYSQITKCMYPVKSE